MAWWSLEEHGLQGEGSMLFAGQEKEGWKIWVHLMKTGIAKRMMCQQMDLSLSDLVKSALALPDKLFGGQQLQVCSFSVRYRAAIGVRH